MASKKPKQTPPPAPQRPATKAGGTPPSKQANLTPQTDKNYLWMAILFILACAIYSNTFSHGYAFDDSIVITDNSYTKSGLKGIPDLLTHDFFEGLNSGDNMNLPGGRYRPLSMVTFAIEYQIMGGLNAPVSHAINVLLYGLTAVMMFLVLGQWFGRSSAVALIASLLYAIHPIHTEAVANIKSRDEILCMLLVLGALYSLWKTLDGKSMMTWGLGGAVMFFGAMMSKETGFMYVVLLPVVVYVFRPELSIKDVLLKSAPFIAAGIFYILLRSAMMAQYSFAITNPDIMENPLVNSDFSEKWGTLGNILWRYFLLNLFPHPMSCDYSYKQVEYLQLFSPISLISWALHLGMVGYAAVRIWKRDVVALCIALYLLPLFPVSNIPFNVGAPMADRFLYMPTFGFCLFLAWGLTKVFKLDTIASLMKSVPVLAILGILVLLGAAKTYQRNPAWKNNLTLFETDVNAAPNSAKIHYYYGNSLQKVYIDAPKPESKPFVQQAIDQFLKAIEINPKFHTVSYNLGLAYDLMGDGPNCRKWLEYTLELQPTHMNSTLLLGKVYAKYFNDLDKGTQLIERYVFEFKHDDFEGNLALGTAYAIRGRLADAEQRLLRAISLKPDDANANINLGQLYMQMGQPDKGNQYIQKGNSLKKK